MTGNLVITRTCDTLLSKQDVWGHCPKEYRDSLYKKLLSVKGFDQGISALECTPELRIPHSELKAGATNVASPA